MPSVANLKKVPELESGVHKRWSQRLDLLEPGCTGVCRLQSQGGEGFEPLVSASAFHRHM